MWDECPGAGRAPGRYVQGMAKLLFITAPTPEVLYQKGKLEGKVRFEGTDKALEILAENGWEVESIQPDWPGPLRKAEEWGPDAVLVACFKRTPIARDAASMIARMQEAPVYVLGVTQKDEAFDTMAPTVEKLVKLEDLPDPS